MRRRACVVGGGGRGGEEGGGGAAAAPSSVVGGGVFVPTAESSLANSKQQVMRSDSPPVCSVFYGVVGRPDNDLLNR